MDFPASADSESFSFPLVDSGELFGCCLDILLYGILTVQFYLYYLAFPNDRKITKAVVILVYTIDTVQTIMAINDVYRDFRLTFIPYTEDPSIVFDSQPYVLWLTVPLSISVIAAITQCFYAYRIYVLSKKKFTAGIVIILALAEVSFGVLGTLIYFAKDFTYIVSILSLNYTGTLGWGAVGIVNNLIIVVYMIWILTMQMKHSTRRATQTTLTKIKRLVMETGLLTVLFMVTYIVLDSCTFGEEELLVGLPLGKIYSNSMLVLLNNRSTIGGGRNEPILEFDIESYHLSDVHRREADGTGTSPAEAD